jgi:glycine oxidase
VIFKNKSCDVAIVGNGSTGLALVFELKRSNPNIRIALIGPKSRVGSASATAGAMLNCWGEIIPGTFENVNFEKRFRLTETAMKMWPKYIENLNEETGLDVKLDWGTVVFTSPTGPVNETENFNYLISSLEKNSINYEKLNISDLGFMSSDTDRAPTKAILINDGRVDSTKLLEALDTFVEKNRIQVHDQNVVSIRKSDKSWDLLLADSTIVNSEKVVFANGAYARDLLDDCEELKNLVLPLFFGAGSAFEVKLPSWKQNSKDLVNLRYVVRTMDRGGACGLHLIPLGEERYYFGASSGVWEEPEKNHRMHAISWLSNSIERDFHHTFFHADSKLRGPGFRPVSLDGFPLIGQIETSGVYMINGTKRDGLTCSPFLAQIISEEILTGNSEEGLSIFNPVRRPISYFEKEKAINSAAHAQYGGEIMHGLKVTPYMHESYINTKIQGINSIYEKRDLSNFGIHPELLHFYEYDSSYDKYVRKYFN